MPDAEEGAAEAADAPSTEPDVSKPASTASAPEARMERILQILLWVGNPDVARALRSMRPAEVTMQPLPIRTALQALRKKRDPVTFLVQDQYRRTIPLVAEAAAEACQDAVIDALGEAADNPDRAQLLTAIEKIRDDFPVSTIALMLAYVSITDMAAADLCDEILQTEESFAIPASVAPPAL
jgi:hypothetical protein